MMCKAVVWIITAMDFKDPEPMVKKWDDPNKEEKVECVLIWVSANTER